MHSLLRTTLVAVVSSATTALLFAACSVQQNQPAGPPQAGSPVASSVGAPGTAASGPAATRVIGGVSPSATGGGLQIPVVSAHSQPVASGAANPAVGVYQQNGASVVNITSLAVLTGFGFGAQPQQQAQPQGIGSGFFIDNDGRIITNNHDLPTKALIEHYNGTSWSIVSSPNPSNADNTLLESVVSTSSGIAWAVGYTSTNTGTNQTVIEQWNGASWNLVSSPNPTTA